MIARTYTKYQIRPSNEPEFRRDEDGHWLHAGPRWPLYLEMGQGYCIRNFIRNLVIVYIMRVYHSLILIC